MDSDLKMNIEYTKRRAAAKEAMMALIDSTNIMGGESEVTAGMIDALRGSHRTLQQSFMRCFVETMKEYGKFNTDLRNQAAVDFAKKINDLEYHIPLV